MKKTTIPEVDPILEKFKMIETRLQQLECPHEYKEQVYRYLGQAEVGNRDYYYEECSSCGKFLRNLTEREYHEILIEKSKQRIKEIENENTG